MPDLKNFDPNQIYLLRFCYSNNNPFPSHAQYEGRYIVSGSLDTIKVWDGVTGQLIHTLIGHFHRGMELKNNYLVSGNADCTVKIWNVVTGRCLHTLSGARQHRRFVEYTN